MDDFHEVIVQLGLRRVVLVGQSAGGLFAIRYAAKYPIEKLVLLSSFYSASFDAECAPGCPSYPSPAIPSEAYDAFIGFAAADYLAFRTTFTNNALNEPCDTQEARAQSVAEGYPTQDIFLNNWAPAGGWPRDSVLGDLASVAVPTLIVYGGIDIVVPINNSFFLRDNIANSQLVEMSGLGHFGNVTNFKKFNCILKRFVKHDEDNRCRVCKNLE